MTPYLYSNSNISRFQRRVRNDPFYGIYTRRLYFAHDKVDATEIREWLEERYVRWERHQYRIIFYPSTDGTLYAHCVYMQTISDSDLIYAKLRWNLSDLTVQLGDRVERIRRPAKPQRASASTRPQLTTDQAEMERRLLNCEAKVAGWSPAQLRAKQAWVTMRTIGWTAPSTQKSGV